MKVNILSENLQKKLPFLNRAVSPRAQLPILLNFLIEAKEGKLKISSTDLEIGIKIEIPANVEEEGVLAIPAKSFSELISSLPAEEKITLVHKEGNLEVKTKSTKSLFQTAPKEDFPSLYEEKGEKLTTFQSDNFKKEASSIVFAASVDAGRPALSGILIKKEKTGFLFVATDGFRLSLKHNLSKISKQEMEESLIIPARVFREVMSLKQENGDVEFFVSKKNNQVLFFEEGAVLVGRLIDAEFPNFEKIIPANYLTKAIFDKEELHKAVKIASIFARDSANIIKLSLNKDKILVSANTPSVGENVVEVESKLEGEETEIAFNAKYLLDLFSNIEGEEMIFETTGPLNPGVFKIQGDSSYLHLIMPIRVQTE